jgi:hypothetical protein
MGGENTPPDLREAVRSGIVATVQRDVELRGGRTARLLVAAGAIGVLGAVGITLMLAAHPFGHHPYWHITVFAAVWSGLLVVSLALVFLQVRTPSLPLARSAAVGILGLGVAGICSAVCPDQHFLRWWSSTAIGAQLGAAGGVALSAVCFGLASSLFLGAVAAFVGFGRARGPIRPLLPAAMLLLLLSPAVALQSFDTSWAIFWSWLLGTAAGAYAGVATGIHARLLFGDT